MAFDLACPADLSVLRIEGADTEVLWSEVVGHVGGVDKDGGGTEPVSTFVTEVVENGMYKILKNVQFGDGANSLTFKSLNEMVYLIDDKTLEVESNATLQLGQLQGSWGINGSMWSFGPSANMTVIASGQTTAAFNCYASKFHLRTAFYVSFADGDIDIRNSIISGVYDGSQISLYIFDSTIQTLILSKIDFVNVYHLALNITPNIISDVHVHYGSNGLAAAYDLTADRLLTSSITNNDIFLTGSSKTINIKDPKENVNTVGIIFETGIIKEQYTCNIHVTDKDGANLSGVTVTCKDKNDNQVFSVQTDGSGDIAEQIIDYKKWEGTSETLTEYSPHKFIFTKAGQRTIEIKNVTVDSPIVWEIEMSGANRALVGGAA